MNRALLVRGGRLAWDGAPTDLLAVDGRIHAIAPHIQPPEDAAVLEAADHLLLPGFLDIHTHGGVGVDFNDCTAQKLQQVSQFFATQGVTGYLPTLLTDTKEQLLDCLSTIRAAMANPGPGARILGVHLEGPFLSPHYRGAMPEHLLRAPDPAELGTYRRALPGCPLHITLSPELPGAPGLIRAALSLGITVSLGHTGADYAETWESIHAGATSATHTGNAMRLLHQHQPAAFGAVLESDLYCEIIADGRHLHPGMVRLMLKTKGYDRIIAVTDSIMATGLGDGSYRLGVNHITVKQGDAWLTDGTSRAGSTLTMSQALRNLAGYTGQPYDRIAPLLSANAAALLGLGARKGHLAQGMDADIAVVSTTGEVVATIVEGALEYACASL